MKNNRKIIIIVFAVFLVLAAVFTTVYFATRSQPQKGEKNIGLSVTYDGKTTEYTIKTEAEYLLEAVQSVVEIKGQDSEYGLFVEEVNERKADSTKEEWWCIEKNGEMHMSGMSSTVISDGEHYELVLKVGYDLF